MRRNHGNSVNVLYRLDNQRVDGARLRHLREPYEVVFLHHAPRNMEGADWHERASAFETLVASVSKTWGPSPSISMLLEQARRSTMITALLRSMSITERSIRRISDVRLHDFGQGKPVSPGLQRTASN